MAEKGADGGRFVYEQTCRELADVAGEQVTWEELTDQQRENWRRRALQLGGEIARGGWPRAAARCQHGQHRSLCPECSELS